MKYIPKLNIFNNGRRDNWMEIENSDHISTIYMSVIYSLGPVNCCYFLWPLSNSLRIELSHLLHFHSNSTFTRFFVC